MKVSVEWIKSEECHWPESVKLHACEVIRLRAEAKTAVGKTASRNMLDPQKLEDLKEIEQLYLQIGVAYRNLRKELAYHIATQG